MDQFKEYKGVFNPGSTDDLQGDAKDFIGVTCLWQPMWVIEDGAYEGDWAMMQVAPEEDWLKSLSRWVPERDIDFIDEEKSDD